MTAQLVIGQACKRCKRTAWLYVNRLTVIADEKRYDVRTWSCLKCGNERMEREEKEDGKIET